MCPWCNSVSLENKLGFKRQARLLVLMCLNFGQTRDSRFFRLFQFHRTQRTAMTRRTARSPANPEKMLLLWSLYLRGKPSARTQLWEGGEVGENAFQEFEPIWNGSWVKDGRGGIGIVVEDGHLFVGRGQLYAREGLSCVNAYWMSGFCM